ncbi:MFS transporter [Pseudoalteromonas sp. S3178]|uniref:MFS transporter n=1 Tax=Pseudoalteromonas sp. S3178 TaxID=579532 RepID=UPI00110ABD81|nr:MFS transporter [Pseudoalteromonas sp. S3178]TMP07369.1 MFS transporter [Pseudoalteromonas sp. S3178]
MNGSKRNVFFFAFIVAFGGFIFGLDAALISGTVRFVSAEFNLSDIQVGTVVSAPGFGVLFALVITGYICNAFGRKNTLIGIAFLYVLSAIASVLAPSYELLVTARFIGGLAFTSLSVAAMYIGEVAPSKYRGKLVSMIQINIVVGLSAAYFANYLLVDLANSNLDWVTQWNVKNNLWRWMLGVEIIPAVLWFLLLFTIPQSPRWLVMKGNETRATAILHRLNKNAELAQDQLKSIKESLVDYSETGGYFSSFKLLLESRVRAAVIIAFTMAIVQQVTGINAIMFYAPTVFEQLGVGTDAAFFNAVLIGLVSIVFTVVAIVLIDRLGRRPLVIWGLAAATISLFMCYLGFSQAQYSLSADDVASFSTLSSITGLEQIIGTVYHSDIEFKQALASVLTASQQQLFESDLISRAATINAPLISFGVAGFIAAFHFSIGPIMWVIFSEIFPTRIRGVAIPTFAFIASVISYFVQQFFPWQLSNLGAANIFLLYTVSGVAGFALLFKFMPETKNKSIEEIEAYLEGLHTKKVQEGM